jgi:hypothetical protein
MNSIRRLFVTAVAFAAVSSVASADVIIGYTTTLGPTLTDLTSQPVTLPAWDPGDGNGTMSNLSGGAYTTGISMASLNSGSILYTLVSYNITVSETVTGNYTITNTNPTAASTGSFNIDTSTALGLGSALAPPLSNTVEPANDLFNGSNTNVGAGFAANGENGSASLSGGPDAASTSTGSITINPSSSMVETVNFTSNYVDLGCEVNAAAAGPTHAGFCNESAIYEAYDPTGFANLPGANNSLFRGNQLTKLGAVETADPLTFYLSTATESDSRLSGGNSTATYNTSVTDTVTVTYDFTETVLSSTPEPTTMVLFVSALVVLGVLR